LRYETCRNVVAHVSRNHDSSFQNSNTTTHNLIHDNKQVSKTFFACHGFAVDATVLQRLSLNCGHSQHKRCAPRWQTWANPAFALSHVLDLRTKTISSTTSCSTKLSGRQPSSSSGMYHGRIVLLLLHSAFNWLLQGKPRLLNLSLHR
jgi:hypothetical protein